MPNKAIMDDKIFKYFGFVCTFIGIILLSIFIYIICIKGISVISGDFLMSKSSSNAEKAGILPGWTGTVWMFVLTALISIPLGVSAAIYLEEYTKKSRMAKFLELNISNLAGVPSVIYGLLGFVIFVKLANFGENVIAGAFTLALLILPIIIVSTREAIRTVPKTIREAAYGMGASKWQTIWTQILPASAGGIMTGTILALSRVVGETAPIILVGGGGFRKAVVDPFGHYDVLPMQIYKWTGDFEELFQQKAAAAIIVLLIITFALNGIAIYFRNKWQKRINW